MYSLAYIRCTYIRYTNNAHTVVQLLVGRIRTAPTLACYIARGFTTARCFSAGKKIRKKEKMPSLGPRAPRSLLRVVYKLFGPVQMSAPPPVPYYYYYLPPFVEMYYIHVIKHTKNPTPSISPGRCTKGFDVCTTPCARTARMHHVSHIINRALHVYVCLCVIYTCIASPLYNLGSSRHRSKQVVSHTFTFMCIPPTRVF